MRKRYAGHPTALVFEDIGGTRGTKKVEELLWGDLLDLQEETDGDFVRVRVRTGEGSSRILGWMKRDSIQDEPLLEVTFVDIGQGDGCLVVTPDDRIMVIDAGQRDDMAKFLRWRLMFPNENRPRHLHAAVISHPDSDHYLGFKSIFRLPGISFEHLYHNGLVERKGDELLGPLDPGSPSLFTDLVKTEERLRTILDVDSAKPGSKQYPDMLREALDGERVNNVRMLSIEDGFMPGFGVGDAISIEVLGPVVETNDNAKTGLRRLGADSVTKNGHSVVFRLTFGNVRVLLGGDLNVPSEALLLEKLMGRAIPVTEAERAAFMSEARGRLEVDVAKSCHHGSADFSSLFLEAVNPIATVISSGDAEAHSHPRAETLGAIGACSRGERPLIYSTELARSVAERFRNPRQERRDLKALHKKVLAETDPKKRRALQARFSKEVDRIIERTVQTFGAIYLRTDGRRAVIGHRYESNRPGKMWDLCHLDPDADGRLHFESEHGH